MFGLGIMLLTFSFLTFFLYKNQHLIFDILASAKRHQQIAILKTWFSWTNWKIALLLLVVGLAFICGF